MLTEAQERALAALVRWERVREAQHHGSIDDPEPTRMVERDGERRAVSLTATRAQLLDAERELLEAARGLRG